MQADQDQQSDQSKANAITQIPYNAACFINVITHPLRGADFADSFVGWAEAILSG